MAVITVRFDAVAKAQVTKVSLSGTVAQGDRVNMLINGKTVVATAAADGIDAMIAAMVEAWNDSDIAEFAEATAEAVSPDTGNDYMTLTADTPGKPFEPTFSGLVSIDVDTVTPGTAGTNEIQSFYFDPAPSGGFYTVSFDPGGGTETSDPIAYNANAAAVLSAILSGMASLDADDLTVTGSGTEGDPFVLTFGETYAASNVNVITVDATSLAGGNSIAIETIRPGSAGASNQLWVVKSQGGSAPTFTISFRRNGSEPYQTTSTLNWNDSVATVQAALEALSNIGSGNVTVTGGRGQTSQTFAFFIEAKGAIGGNNWNATSLIATGTNVGKQIISIGGAATGDEYQVVNLGLGTAGTYTLSDGVDTTSAIAFNASDSTVKTRIIADFASLTNANVDVDDFGTVGVMLVHYFGDKANTNVNAMSIGVGSLTGTGVIQTARGGGTAGVNEQQAFWLDDLATGGSFTLTYSGQTTGPIAVPFTTADIDSALEALSNIATGDVSVTGGGTEASPTIVEFGGALASTNVAEMTGSAANVTGAITATIATDTAGSGPTNEVQTITLTGAGGGTFKLGFNDEQTANIAYTATNYTVRDALCNLSNIAGTDEVQTISSTASGGDCDITYSGQTALAVAFNITAANLKLALEALSNIGVDDVACTGGPLNVAPIVVTFRNALGRKDVALMTVNNTNMTGGVAAIALTTAGVDSDVTVTGSAGGPYTVTFVNALAATNVSELEADNTLLTGSSPLTATTSTLTASSGPNHADDVTNYSGGALPTNSDTLVFTNSNVDFLYGLDALAAVTLTELIITSTYEGKIGLPEYDKDGAYYQYRDRYFQVKATRVVIGQGDGSGSGRINLDLGTAQTTVDVLNTGTPEGDDKSLSLRATHAANTLNLIKGSVDIAREQGVASAFATIKVSFDENQDGDADLRCGDNVTLTTVTVQGGEVSLASNTTDLVLYAGKVTVWEGVHTDIDLYAGVLEYNSDGDITDLYVSNALADFSHDPRPKEVVNTVQGYRGGELRDTLGVLIAAGLVVKDNTGEFKVTVPPGKTYTIA